LTLSARTEIGSSPALVIDANVWVSYFVPADDHYLESQAWIDETTEREQLMYAPTLLIAEVAGGIARRTRPARADAVRELLAELPNLKLVSLDDELASRAAVLAARMRLRGADAVYLALAEWLVLPLITWDRELRTRGAIVTPVQTPTEALAQP